MPQPSTAYAIGFIRMQQRGALKDAQINRLLQASGLKEALGILAESGFIAPEEQNIDKAASSKVDAACKLVKALSPRQEWTDPFLERYDFQNLKALLKARLMDLPKPRLSPNGVIAPALLEQATAEHRYNRLPATLQKALDELEKRLALKPDPMLVDLCLDRAYYERATEALSTFPGSAPARYFKAQADFTNANIAIRSLKLAGQIPPLSQILVTGGQIPLALFEGVAEKPDALVRAFALYGNSLKQAFSKALADFDRLPAFEKQADNELLKLFKPFRMSPYAPEAVIGHLLYAQREAGIVRLILAGKQNHFSAEAIQERLRESYV